MILMKGKTDYRSLEIEDLIERGLGSGDSLGKRFHARTYSLDGFFSSHYTRTQRSGLTGNRLIAKVLRRMPGFRWWGIVWAGIEFFHEEVDLFTAEEFRDNAEAPSIERGGDCFEISHEYPLLNENVLDCVTGDRPQVISEPALSSRHHSARHRLAVGGRAGLLKHHRKRLSRRQRCSGLHPAR